MAESGLAAAISATKISPNQQPTPGGAGPTVSGESNTEAETLRRELSDLKVKYAPWEALGKRFAGVGGPEAIGNLVGQVAQLAQRPDFTAYVGGRLVAQAAEVEEPDEFLSDEQREIRDLRRELESVKSGTSGQNATMTRELGEIRFERAEKAMAEKFGSLWTERRPEVLDAVRRIVAQNGHTAVSQIDDTLLHKAFVSVLNPQEFEEAMTKWVTSRESNRQRELSQRATTTPHTEASAGPIDGPAKSLSEAIGRGIAEAKAKAERGEYVQ